ncbi:MAG: hypothetical protein Q7S22_00265 [Candidatus Micrarchaeota archaeon]|nr:hypothetical protein [Candidatus Micrarchaeota archaeon]
MAIKSLRGQAAVSLTEASVKAGTLRGQAAIEYITTYGWALLVLVIIIAAIFSTGILSPSYLISEECTLGPNLPCNFQLYQEGTSLNITLNITNGFGYKINITDFTANLSEEQMYFVFGNLPQKGLESGDSVKLVGYINPYSSSKNSIKKIKSQVKYYSCAPEINMDCLLDNNEHIISGRIVGRIS